MNAAGNSFPSLRRSGLLCKEATLNFGHEAKLLRLSDRTTALIVPYCYRGDRKGQRGRGRAHTRTALTENWVICDQLSY